jgi:predicted CXXCH cytochrome family protein
MGNPASKRLFLIVVGLLVIAAAGVAADWWRCLPSGLEATYVGRDTCARCHAEQLRAWTGSDHDLAMDPATEQTVLGDFNDREFTYNGVTSRMFRDGQKFLMTTDGADGKLETFSIKYTFGWRPLQQYLVEFDDGRIQCLPIAWDTQKKCWFHLYPNEKIDHNDVLHWTKPAQNWNYMCAECHSTNVEKNYDLRSNTYHTTFSEIDVSCESCHGPGSIHVQLAESTSLFWDRRYGMGLAKLKGKSSMAERKSSMAEGKNSEAERKSSKAELDTCAKCHSRRRIVYPDFKPGDEFLDHYVPSLLDEGLYHADGQILDEVYVYGSFLQSRMYREGVRCTDCHDPHTTRVRAQGNALCAQCHVPGKYDGPAHHHHPVDSKGALCVECHMPTKNYMVVDPRRDHSLRIPRPDLTVALGTPNACNGCHDDKDAQWSVERVAEWFGRPRRRPQHYAYAFAAAREGKPDAPELLRRTLRRKDNGPIVRATAAALLSRYRDSLSLAALQQALTDPEPLVQASAMRNLADLPVSQLQQWLAPLLDHRVRLVRTEAARLLSAVPSSELSDKQRKDLDRALAEFRDGQLATSDQPGAHLNLGVVYANLGELDQAVAAYQTALRVDPQFVPARFNLATLYNGEGKNAEAEKLLRDVISIVPDMADAYYSLGLLLAEDEKRIPEAADALAQAAELAPQRPRIRYNLGLALERLERYDPAEKALRAACELEPRSTEFLYALTLLYIQQQRWPAALQCTDRLQRLEPGNPQWARLSAQIQSQRNRSRDDH